MKLGPNIAEIGALIGDPARANMLIALMDGRALTASELAQEAGITKQTASSHLSKLNEAKFLTCEPQGRHRYFKIADREIANLLENMLGVAEKHLPARVRTGPKEPAMRYARVCYDHLAGDMGVRLYDHFLAQSWLAIEDDIPKLTELGENELSVRGLDLKQLKKQRRPLCRSCLDWSVRRHHLAGGLGAAILEELFDRKWASREETSRVITFSPVGERRFIEQYGLNEITTL